MELCMNSAFLLIPFLLSFSNAQFDLDIFMQLQISDDDALLA